MARVSLLALVVIAACAPAVQDEPVAVEEEPAPEAQPRGDAAADRSVVTPTVDAAVDAAPDATSIIPRDAALDRQAGPDAGPADAGVADTGSAAAPSETPFR